MMQSMSGLKTEFGPAARIAAQAVKYQRERLGLSYAQLSRKLTLIGRDIPTLGLRRIESAQRRVDVDDLIALAMVFEVSPITLLMPPEADSGTSVVMSGTCVAIPVKQFWNWLNASYPLTGSVMAFYSAALPQWERDEVEQRLGNVRP